MGEMYRWRNEVILICCQLILEQRRRKERNCRKRFEARVGGGLWIFGMKKGTRWSLEFDGVLAGHCDHPVSLKRPPFSHAHWIVGSCYVSCFLGCWIDYFAYFFRFFLAWALIDGRRREEGKDSESDVNDVVGFNWICLSVLKLLGLVDLVGYGQSLFSKRIASPNSVGLLGTMMGIL
ncbi:hypothetical protein HPP92_027234 [Vanilla planifolia]|uniref:Uncharacterized protein n=1 Tax=Vanilla planifolia TaxID=51239 RepID=A0A835PBP3_VANPL|nr:hypothetical protein HPP92_027234 [Vanilla planifolia]